MRRPGDEARRLDSASIPQLIPASLALTSKYFELPAYHRLRFLPVYAM